MADRMQEVVEDDDDKGKIDKIVMVDGPKIAKTIDHNDDAFVLSPNDIQKVSGLNPAFKRKVSRELNKVMEGDGGARSKRLEPNAQTNAYNLFKVVSPPYNLDYLAKLYELSAPNFAAIRAKVTNVVALGYDFVESPGTRDKVSQVDDAKKDAMRRKVSRLKDNLYDWLDSCNKEDQFTETLIKVWTDYESTGNGYLEVGRKVTGEIGYLGHVSSVTVRVREPRDGYVQLIGTKAVYFKNYGDSTKGNPIGGDSSPNEIIHFKKYTPTNSYYGIPDIVAASQAVAGNEFSARFNLDYFENKAVPRYVITLKGGELSARATQTLMEFFQNVKGKNHRSIFVPLPADTTDRKVDFKMEPVEAGTQDSSFNNYRKANLGEILMAHRVPISKVGLAEGVSLAVARDADKTFAEQVCRPEQRILEKKLNNIISELTDVVRIKMKEMSLSDEETVSKLDERYLRWGVMRPNDIRVGRWGWDALKDGDKPATMGGALTGEDAAKADAKNAAKTADAQASAAAAQQKATAGQTRTRDAERSSSASDSAGEARQAQGEGRATS